MLNDDSFLSEVNDLNEGAYKGTDFDYYKLIMKLTDKPDVTMEVRSTGNAIFTNSYDNITFRRNNEDGLDIKGKYIVSTSRIDFETKLSKANVLDPIKIKVTNLDFITLATTQTGSYTVNTYEELKDLYMREAFKITKEVFEERPEISKTVEECENKYYSNELTKKI